MKIVIRHSRTKMVHALGVYCRVRVRWWGSFEYDKLVLFKASVFNGSITLWRNTFYNVIIVYTRKKRWVKLSSNCRITSQNIGWKNWRDLSVLKSVGGRGLILSKLCGRFVNSCYVLLKWGSKLTFKIIYFLSKNHKSLVWDILAWKTFT